MSRPSVLTDLLKTRHTTRMFSYKPVPKDLVKDALEIARHAPSNSNTQPWRIVFASGAKLERIRERYTKEYSSGTHPPYIPPYPHKYVHHHHEMAAGLYTDTLGIPREDKETRFKWILGNFRFYEAPLLAIITMHNDFSYADSVSVGMFLMVLLTALQEQDLGSCIEICAVGYPSILREELDIDDSMRLVVGVAIGYEKEGEVVNTFRPGKMSVDEVSRWVDGETDV